MNLKSLLLSFLGITLCASSAFAIPARKGFHSFTQPDGSKISLQKVGDEYFHTLSTPDGLAVEKGADGFFYYSSANGITNVRVSSGSPEDEAYIKENASKLTVKSVMNSQKSKISKARALRAPKRALDKSQVPPSGSPRIPILLVQYADYKFKDKDPKATFTDFFSTGKVSAHQYFADQSNGKYNPQFDVYGPVTLPKNRAYYGGDTDYTYDEHLGEMVAVGCQNLDSQINYADYDNDGDGICDVIIMLYAGDGQASSYEEDAEDAVWPCQWELSGSDYGKSLKLDNTVVNKFAVFNELNGIDLSKIDGIGTFCHEFSHCLGLPDFYDTEYGPHFGMGPWSLMDYGSYNDDGYTPVGYCAYEKEFMGWLNIEEGKENTSYTLPIFNQKNAATDKAVKLTNPADSNEYFILENRANQGWDKYMPAEGLFIYHITFSEDHWNSNVVNNYDLQRVTPVPADNELKLKKTTSYGETYYEIDEASLAGDLWPYNGNNEFTDESKPAAKVNKGGYLGKPITEITKNSDGTISFHCMKAALPKVNTPSNLSHVVNNSTSATIHWEAPAGSEAVTYDLELSPYRESSYLLISSTHFDNNNHGWEVEGFTELDKNENAIRLASNKNYGLIASPSFESNDDIVTVGINARKYSSKDNSTLYVALVDDEWERLDYAELTLTDSYKTHLILLEGMADTEMSLWIWSEEKGRSFIKSVDIYSGDASAEFEKNNVRKSSSNAETIFISGLTTTSHTLTDLTDGGIYQYRVRAVPVDTENYSASPWSEFMMLNLGDTTEILEIPSSEDSADATYYTIQGHLLLSAPTAPGIYIKVTKGKAEKFIQK